MNRPTPWPRAQGLTLAALLPLAGPAPAHGAQQPTPVPPPTQGTASQPAPPPLPPPTRPPVEFFLELLSASPARRQQLLEGKTPTARETIQRRIAEFENLDPESRADAEWQLRLAQFRFYLSPLLSLPAEQRAARLAMAPEQDRPLLAERLNTWDAMDEPTRRQVLESHGQFHHFASQSAADPARLASLLATASAPAKANIEAQFTRWRALPETERRQRSAAFQSIFDLPAERRSRALKGLSEPERQAMQRSLERFSGLPQAERDRCIAGLERLARLAPDHRDAFLRNAALWQAMSPSERDQWRRLVFNLSPPPLPPIHAPARVATNH